MTSEQSFKELKAGIASALVNATRTAGQISNEDLAYQRSTDPKVNRLLQEQNRRLLGLVRDLNKSATAGTDTLPPPLKNVESVDDAWRGIVDVVDNLLEKADACLDEFTGVIKKLTPGKQNGPATALVNRPLAKHEYRYQNILKPQRLFKRVPKPDETTPFKPLLTSKPNAIVPLEQSLVTAPQLNGGSLQYNVSLLTLSSMIDRLTRLQIQTPLRDGDCSVNLSRCSLRPGRSEPFFALRINGCYLG